MKSFKEFIKEAGMSPGDSNPTDRGQISNDELDRNSKAAGEPEDSYVMKTINRKLETLPSGDFDKNHIDPPKESEGVPSNHMQPSQATKRPMIQPQGRFAP